MSQESEVILRTLSPLNAILLRPLMTFLNLFFPNRRFCVERHLENVMGRQLRFFQLL